MLTTLTAPHTRRVRRAPPKDTSVPQDTSQTLKFPRETFERARMRADADGRTLRSVLRDAVLQFLLGELEPRKVPRAPYGSGGHRTPAGILMSELYLARFKEQAEGMAPRLGFKPTLSDVVWTYLEFTYAPASADAPAEE